MTNAEMISKLRILQGAILNPHHRDGEYVDKRFADVCVAAADALEAADKRIAVLEDELLPKSGEWIQMNGHKYCSRCGHKDSPILTRYCPNCGANMKRGEDK